ncbi:MAG: hypothetical protein K0R53_3086 [Burkholderiales bacterium]|nr:hypothetical protein [Burkholderiales bacterium]
MDGPQFDAWTRRRLSVAAGGLATSLAGLAAIGPTAAKRAKRRKRSGAATCSRRAPPRGRTTGVAVVSTATRLPT